MFSNLAFLHACADGDLCRSRPRYTELVNLMLVHGFVDPDCAEWHDGLFYPPLLEAARSGDRERVNLLIRYGGTKGLRSAEMAGVYATE